MVRLLSGDFASLLGDAKTAIFVKVVVRTADVKERGTYSCALALQLGKEFCPHD
jgi:hypothetical protein